MWCIVGFKPVKTEKYEGYEIYCERQGVNPAVQGIECHVYFYKTQYVNHIPVANERVFIETGANGMVTGIYPVN